MCKASIGITLILVTLALVATGADAKAAQPGDYLVSEILNGEVGAIEGGVVGWIVCHPAPIGLIFAPPPTRVAVVVSLVQATEASPQPRCLGENIADWGLAGTFLDSPSLWIDLGRAVGASTGVVRTGLDSGVEGNIGLAYGATLLWAILTEYELHLDKNIIVDVPFLPDFIATIAFNWGAKMKGNNTQAVNLSWQLPLFDLSF
jgi:hypothetical protein